jgi:hypothetical protein
MNIHPQHAQERPLLFFLFGLFLGGGEMANGIRDIKKSIVRIITLMSLKGGLTVRFWDRKRYLNFICTGRC